MDGWTDGCMDGYQHATDKFGAAGDDDDDDDDDSGGDGS